MEVRVALGVAVRHLLPPGIGEDGEVVQHRQLGREQAERLRASRGRRGAANGGAGRSQIGPEQERGERGPRHDEDLAARRQHQDEQRQQVQEVAVPHRAPSAVPVVRDDPDVEEPGDARAPRRRATPRSVRGPRTRNTSQRQDRGQEIRQRAAEAADPEVVEVAEEGDLDLAARSAAVPCARVFADPRPPPRGRAGRWSSRSRCCRR